MANFDSTDCQLVCHRTWKPFTGKKRTAGRRADSAQERWSTTDPHRSRDRPTSSPLAPPQESAERGRLKLEHVKPSGQRVDKSEGHRRCYQWQLVTGLRSLCARLQAPQKTPMQSASIKFEFFNPEENFRIANRCVLRRQMTFERRGATPRLLNKNSPVDLHRLGN